MGKDLHPPSTSKGTGSQRRRRGAPSEAGVVPRVTATARPLRFRRLPTADVASRRVPVAVTLLSRLLGLALLRAERAGRAC